MYSISLHQFLTIYTWFALAVLLFLLALIARFYERLSHKRTFYRLFFIPVTAFAGATVLLTSQDRVTGYGWGDILLLLGGVSLAVLCVHMYRLMTSGR
jgi:hypothetical protein